MASQLAHVQAASQSRRDSNSVPLLILALSVAAVADVVTLFRNIPTLGLGAEVNPVALYLLANFGPWVLVAAKALSVAFASSVGLSLVRMGRVRLARVTLSVCCLATILAVLSNIWSV